MEKEKYLQVKQLSEPSDSDQVTLGIKQFKSVKRLGITISISVIHQAVISFISVQDLTQEVKRLKLYR